MYSDAKIQILDISTAHTFLEKKLSSDFMQLCNSCRANSGENGFISSCQLNIHRRPGEITQK